MALPPVVSDFLEWRWMPSVALAAGSIVFVGLAVALIPSQTEGSKATATLSPFDRPAAPPSTTFAASLPQIPAVSQPVRRAMMAPQPEPIQVVERQAEPPPAPLPETPAMSPMPTTVTPEPAPDPNAPHREN